MKVTSPWTEASEATEQTSVGIVGGGPVGLALAGLLGQLGVRVILLERRHEAASHPRARSINLRTNEIFRGMGLLDALRAVSLPEEWTRRMIYVETLAGREIGRIETSTQGVVDGRRLSPAPWLLSSQDQIEPILRRHAGSLPGVSLRFATELVDFAQDTDGVTVHARSTPTGRLSSFRARWLVAADGAASPVRRKLGIAMSGRHDLATLVNCHFRADLRRYTEARPAILYWTTAPARNVFQKTDLADRWLCQIGYDPKQSRPEDFTPARSAEWIRASVGADLDVDVLDVIPWTMSSTVAERWRSGRVFLAGDAAHQLPPSGGFGMNTGVQDAHNLAWKLAWVERGRAREALLDSYETERAPIAAYNAARSLENSEAVGRIRKLAERGDSSETGLAGARRYGNWLGMDLGLHYERGALVPDGTEAPRVDDPVATYAPVARPGHRAPHVELEDSGRPISSLDLFNGAFCLLTGRAGADWCEAALELGLRAYRVGGDVADPGGEFRGVYEIDADGAVLVRPDGHVAWRTRAGSRAPERELRQLLETLMIH